MTVEFERGRNDRRDGKDNKAYPYEEGSVGRGRWLGGWALQDAMLKNDKTFAYKLGRKDAKDGVTVSVYPIGTTSYLEWKRGYDEFMAAQEKAAEETPNA